MRAFSVLPWGDRLVWTRFFQAAEEVLGAKLTHLDINDPLKRRVGPSNFDQSGDYVVDFGSKENSRWIFGRFKDAKIGFTIHHHNTPRVNERDFPNSLSVYFPETYLNSEGTTVRVEQLFDATNRLLEPFYSYADLSSEIVRKKKASGAVSLQQELVGVFWLTYFDAAYVEFFGSNVMMQTGCASPAAKGVMLKLGNTPLQISSTMRRQIECHLGPHSFVNPEADLPKCVGRHALTFVRLNSLTS